MSGHQRSAGTAPARRWADAAHVELPLRDGRVVALRPQRPDDLDGLVRFFAGLTPSSRSSRFLAAMPTVPQRFVRPLVEIDQVGHVAWLAVAGGCVVGEVRAVRLRDEPQVAEVAFAVAEGWRRIGLGRLLVEAIGVVAAADGIATFASSVGGDNRASTGLLGGLGTRFRVEHGVLEGRGPAPPWTGPPAVAPRILALQRAAAVPGSVDRAAA